MESVRKQPRNTSIELLRFAFMFLIVLLHVYAHGTEHDYQQIYDWGKNMDTAFHLSLFSIGKIGVTGFMFISGYYGIHTNCHKVIDLILITLFYLLVLSPVEQGFEIFLYLHPFDGWWFVSSYLFIMFIAPLIEIGIKTVSQTTFRYIVIAALVYTYFAQALCAANSHDAVFLLTIYLAARYFKLHMVDKSAKWRWEKYIGILAILLLMIIPVLASKAHLPMTFFNLFVQNNNPLLLIISGWLVWKADKHKFRNATMNKLLKSTLAIYIITDAANVRSILTQTLLPEVMQGIGFMFIFIICIICLLVDQIRVIIFNLIYKKLLWLIKRTTPLY